MLQLIRKYWTVWIINIASVITFVWIARLSVKNAVCIVVYEAFFIGMLILKERDDKSRVQKVFRNEGDKLVVKGVFKKMEFNKNDIVQFGVSKNFLARVFDWSKVSITTNSGTHVIYTHEMKTPPELF